MDIRRAARVLLTSLLLAPAGCGGGAPTPTPALTPNPPVPATRPAVASAPSTPPARPKANRPKVVDAAPQFAVLPEGTAERDGVEVVATGPSLEVLAPDAVLDQDRLVVAAVGTAGSDFWQISGPTGTPTASGSPAANFKLPAGFEAIKSAGYSAEGLARKILDQKTGSEMVLIPAGLAYLGTETGPSHVQPRVPVLLDAYYIDQTEVTLEQYGRYRADLVKNKRGKPQEPLNNASPANHPAQGISWTTANAFAKWADKELPTEAEFEKAARGTEGLRTPWGNGRAIWPDNRQPETISAVGSYQSDYSPFGVYDLAGNVREWCSDWYSEEGHKEARAGSAPVKNWLGARKPTATSHRVLKGGDADWSVWAREGANMSDRPPTAGFRCVLRINTAPESPAKPSGFRPTAGSN